MSIKAIKPRLETALETAYATLLHHIDEEYIDPVDQIPRFVIEKCEAVIFLTEIKNLDGSKSSNGILMFHPSKGEWGAPCSVYLEDTHDINGSIGLHLAEKNYMLFIRDSNTLHEFFQQGRLHIINYGDKVNIMDGPVGRNTILENNLSHDDKPLAEVLCYAISKNIITDKNSKINTKDHYKWLDDCEIVISNIDNKNFYINKVDAGDINKLEILESWYKNRVPIPDHDKYYYDLITKLTEYLDQPNKLKALAEDKIQKFQEDITDKIIEHAKAEIKTQAKQEIKNRIFGKDEMDIIKDNIEEGKIEDGNVNDTRDVRLLKGAVKRAGKLISNVLSAGEENNENGQQSKSDKLPNMSDPNKITIPITKNDFPSSVQQKDA